MPSWHITRYDSLEPTRSWDLPGNLSESEIEEILKRLVCSNLTEAEIISASMRKNDPDRSTLLERVGAGRPISFGENPHYTADYKDT